MSPTAQFILFIIVFILILAAYITFIVIVARRLNRKVALRRHAFIEGIIIVGIITGIVFMFQQITLSLFEPGFLILLISLLAFILWSHVPPKPAPSVRGENNSEVVEQ
jgi:hypothetical protein